MSTIVSGRADAVEDDLSDRGFTLDEKQWATVARGGADPAALSGVDAPLAVVPLRNGRPLTVVSAVANATDEGLVAVLVADARTEKTVEPMLSGPFLLQGRQAGGRRFLTVEDRILLSDSSYACTAASGDIEWFEDADGVSDDPPLVLEAGGKTVTVLDSVEGLVCPGPSVSAFEYSYARGEDGQFRVFADGQAVGRYTSVGAMRADGLRPVPLPLVPEHHVRGHGRLARATLLATVDDAGGVTYRSFS